MDLIPPLTRQQEPQPQDAHPAANGHLHEPATTEQPAGPATTAKPVVLCNDISLTDATAAALNALANWNQAKRDETGAPELFEYAGLLAWIKTSTGRFAAPFVEPLGNDALRYVMAESAHYVKEYMTKNGPRSDQIPPPMEIVKAVAAQKKWAPKVAPHLDAIVECPRVTPSWKILTSPGYDPDSGLYYQPAADLAGLEIPDRPSRRRIAWARDLFFKQVFVDFPFADEPSKAHALAVALNPFIRPAIDGPTPAFEIDASVCGSGKGLLADVICLIAMGRNVEVYPEPHEEAEWSKALLSLLLRAPQIVCFDNINAEVSAGQLAAAITAYPLYTGRPFGFTKTVSVPVNCTWILTGNNIQKTEEIKRRHIPIRIEPKIEQPWLRTEFVHPRLRKWVRKHRKTLVKAALTLCQAWIVKGRPIPKDTVMLGSFEHWSEVMGGILHVAEVEGFLANTHDPAKMSDDFARLKALVGMWHDAFGFEPVQAAALVEVCERKQIYWDKLVDKKPEGRPRLLGRDLAKAVGRVFDKFKITKLKPDGHGVATYQLQLVSGDPAGAGGQSTQEREPGEDG